MTPSSPLNLSKEEAQRVLVDVENTISEYLHQSDWRVNENANQGYSLGGMILNTSGKITAHYWLNMIYPKSVREAHTQGAMHLHDLGMFSGYCAGWSLRQLLEEGFNGVPGKVESDPPKHFETALGQMVNFLGTLQNEWAGAQAFSSFDTMLAPYAKNDGLSYEQIYQGVQQFVFNLNVPSRWGMQTPFTNITIDWTVPEDLREKQPVIAGKQQPFTYADCQPEMDLINRAFIEVMTRGDRKGRIFTFPIPTYNVTKDFVWDSENAKLLFEMTAKYGIPYFQNFLNSSLQPSDVRSMCCRSAARSSCVARSWRRTCLARRR
jgi:anaerobic ribonucleoside-triphosphate reductase